MANFNHVDMLTMRCAGCSKKTIFRSTIEASTKQQMREAAEDWVANAHRWLEPPIPIASAFSSGSPTEDVGDYPAVRHLNR